MSNFNMIICINLMILNNVYIKVITSKVIVKVNTQLSWVTLYTINTGNVKFLLPEM